MPMSGDRVVDFAQMMIRRGHDSLLRQIDWKSRRTTGAPVAALKQRASQHPPKQ